MIFNIMKTRLLFKVILAILPFSLLGGPIGYDNAVQSKVSGDLILILWADKTTHTIESSRPISFSILTVTNETAIINLPTDDYMCLAKMTDIAGKSVPLRADKRHMGQRFFDLKYSTNQVLWDDIKNVVRMKPDRDTGPKFFGEHSKKAEFFLSHRDGGGGSSLGSPDDIFDVSHPGKYQLDLQLQTYVHFHATGTSQKFSLVRFEPLHLFVIKRN